MTYKEYKHQWYLKNKKRLGDKRKQDRINNPEKYKEFNKKYYLKNKKTICKRTKEYRLKNLEHLKQKAKEWRKKNKVYLKIEKRKEYLKNKNQYLLRSKLSRQRRYNKDIQFTLTTKIRRRIHMAIRKQFTSKAYKTRELLGCDYISFKKYFSSLFKKGMNWNKFNKGEIHIDHIRPCSSFDLTKSEEQRKCFHYTNTQPLWAKENLSKGAKLEWQN
jgi:hypothetical protein